ncbi:hypothetical protein LINPERPRIM_LOCUS11871 [Linum perenne]
MVALFAALPALRQLKLGIELLLFLSDGQVPYKLSGASFTNLEVLEIPRLLLDSLPEARVFVCLIMSSPNLRILTIVQRYQFVVPPGSMVGFSKLTLLELKEVDIPDNYDFFGTLLPHCPLLEELRVFDCTSTIEPLFESASLKALFFHSCFKTICFKDTSRLSVLSVVDTGKYCYCDDDFIDGVYDPDMVALFAALPALKQLELGIELLLVNSLQMLLELKDDHHPGGVCCLQRLEEFSIHICHGDQVELDLARFVLATAPLLKTVFVKPTEGLPSEDAITYLVEMTQYKRISKEAEVKYMQLMSIDED